MTKKLLILVVLFLVSGPAFAQSVDTAWVRRYNGPGNSQDDAYAMAVDGSGNIYVTGYSYGSGTREDYATIKYYPNGDTAWVRRYNGPGNATDEAYAIAMDSSRNVYVTGDSYGSGSDYATIKYYDNGDTAWVRRYTGPGVDYDGATALVVDGSINVYVTGETSSSGSNRDYATIKYYPNGDTAWARKYDGPVNGVDGAEAIVMDSSGNIYVTGTSLGNATGYDYATIKYYPNGDTAWLRRYNGPGSTTDAVNGMVVDRSGNIYVTGYSYGSVTDVDYATIKYYPNGDTAWVRRYNDPVDSFDYAKAIVVDSSINIYVSGYSYGGVTGVDYATIKYYPNGDTAWVRRYSGPANDRDYALAIAVDGSGNIYVTGYSKGSGTDYDYATIKYDPSGDTAWVRRYNGPANSYDLALAIAVDNSGNVFVTGKSQGSGTGYDYATIKYVQFLCGDANKDGVVDVGDVVYIINYLYKNGSSPVPILKAGDASCDGVVDVGDVVYLINYLFKNGSEPCC